MDLFLNAWNFCNKYIVPTFLLYFNIYIITLTVMTEKARI